MIVPLTRALIDTVLGITSLLGTRASYSTPSSNLNVHLYLFQENSKGWSKPLVTALSLSGHYYYMVRMKVRCIYNIYTMYRTGVGEPLHRRTVRKPTDKRPPLLPRSKDRPLYLDAATSLSFPVRVEVSRNDII